MGSYLRAENGSYILMEKLGGGEWGAALLKWEISHSAVFGRVTKSS